MSKDENLRQEENKYHGESHKQNKTMETNSNKVIIDLTKVSYWTAEEGYTEHYLEDTGILPELDSESTVERMVSMHSELEGISYSIVKEVGTPYIEQALMSVHPNYKVGRISDLLEEILGFEAMRGVDIEHDGRENGIEITYTAEAVKKLKELYAEYEDYNLVDMTIQALADVVERTPIDNSAIIDLAWGCIDTAFDEEIKKAEEQEEGEWEAEEAEYEEFLEKLEQRFVEARKLSDLDPSEFDDRAETLMDCMDDIHELSPRQIAQILRAMQLSYQGGRAKEHLEMKKAGEIK